MVSEGEPGKRAGILIVEDEPLIASLIGAVLAELGYRVVGAASSGAEALALASRSRPSLALVDIRLSGPTDGIEVACALRERFAVPAIFLSGVADPATVERAERARPAGFLAKPFRPSQVFDAIELALQQQAR
jgi:DNA-binding NarL/FixJ family response regulator